MSRKELLADWYHRVWVEQDLDAIDSLISSDTEAKGLLPAFRVGPEEFRSLVPIMLELVEDFSITVDKAIEEGDWLAALVSISAINPANGERVHGICQFFARFEGDKIVEAYNNVDFISLLTQLGLLPPDTMEICLTGQKIQ